MKKMAMIFTMMMTLMLLATSAWGKQVAAPKFIDAIPYLQNDEVCIPPLPGGAKLIKVEIYDDIRGIPPVVLTGKDRFTLPPGKGFNFKYQDSQGKWWQMITPGTQMLMKGTGLKVDCTNLKGCKFVRPWESDYIGANPYGAKRSSGNPAPGAVAAPR